MVNLRKFEIKNPHDVAAFFLWLVFDCKVNPHPDDDFEEYTDSDGEYLFSDEEAKYLNYTMKECFEVCEKCGRDIYEIADRIAAIYCERNDIAAGIEG